MKRKILMALCIIIGLIVFMFSKTSLKTKEMITKEYENFVFYFEEKDRIIMGDIEEVLEKNHKQILTSLNFEKSTKAEVYVYPDIKTFQSSSRGRIYSLLKMNWFIGDNKGDKILIVSPLNPGDYHDKKSVIQTSIHEYAHSIVQSINKDTPKYLDEGLAMYFANQKPIINSKDNMPTLKNLFYMKNNTINSLKFGMKGQYDYASIYVEFLIEKYGINKVNELIENPKSIEKILGQSPEDVYRDWDLYLEDKLFII